MGASLAIIEPACQGGHHGMGGEDHHCYSNGHVGRASTTWVQSPMHLSA